MVMPMGRKIGWSGLRSTIRAPPEREEFIKYKQITMDRYRSKNDVTRTLASGIPAVAGTQGGSTAPSPTSKVGSSQGTCDHRSDSSAGGCNESAWRWRTHRSSG